MTAHTPDKQQHNSSAKENANIGTPDKQHALNGATDKQQCI